MKSFACLIGLLLCVCMAGSAAAESQDLYFNLGVGWPDANYPGDIEGGTRRLDRVAGIDHRELGFDLGIYFPILPGMLLGFTASTVSDRYSDDHDHLEFRQEQVGLSFRWYASHRVGKGFFIRGDFGSAKLILDTSFEDNESESGKGFLAGIGYSWRVFGKTWFSVNGDYKRVIFDDEHVGTVSAGGALLF